MSKREIYFFIFSLIIFLEPQIFKEDTVFFANEVDSIYKILKLFCVAIIGIKYLKYYMKTPSKFVIFTCTLQFITFLSTIINKGDITRFFGPASTTVAMAMASEILIKKEGLLDVLKKVNIYLRICFVLNVISIILIDFTSFKDLCNVYFLGIDNRFIFTFLPWILFEGITSYIEHGKLDKNYHLCFIGCELTLFYKFSLSAMLALILFIIPSIKNINLAKFKNIAFISMIAANMALVVSNVSKYFRGILTVLGKDITLGGRTYLWNGAVQEIKNNLLIGKRNEKCNCG